jgi:Tol biopolymer transport system component
MSDFVSSVLDELVPTFSDEAGDWERVVADAAGTPTTAAQPWPLDMAAASAAPRRRRALPARCLTRRRLVAVSAAVLAVLLVTPALGIGDRLLSLIQNTPSRLDVQAPAWSRDGRSIVFVSWRDGNGEVYAMDADSSSPRNLTQDPAKDVRPAWSPDGRRIAFVSRRDANSEVYVMNADGSGKRNLTRDRANDDYPTWSPDGRRIAFLRGRLRTPTAPPDRFYGYDLYVVNADGSGLRRLSLRVPEGTPQTRGRVRGGQVVWSPDGRTIYFGRYVVRADGSGARRLQYIPLTAVWSPDGTRIAFAAQEGLYAGTRKPGPCCYSSHADIYVMNADGSGIRELTHDARQNAEPAWSPDGRRIAFVSRRDGNADIYVMNADGSGKRNLTRNPAKDYRPSWSPDGRRIAFVSDREGRLEAFVMNADGSGQRSLAVRGT